MYYVNHISPAGEGKRNFVDGRKNFFTIRSGGMKMEILSTADIEFIKQIVCEAGTIARNLQCGDLDVRRKSDTTLVTEADLAVQNFIIVNLRGRFPQFNYIHEENFDQASTVISDDTITAVIDPIDGTAMYTMGLPEWCVSVGIFYGYEPRYGFVYSPGANMLFHCDNEKSFLNGNVITTRGVMLIDRETNLFYASEIRNRHILDFPGKIRNLGSTAFHACLTVDNERNRVLAFIGRSFLWDWAGAIPVIIKAGGKVRYLSGKEINFREVFQNGCSFPEELIATGTQDIEKICHFFRKTE